MTRADNDPDCAGPLSPQLISSIEISPVTVIAELLRATGPTLADDLIHHQARLIKDRVATKAAARHSALTLYTRKSGPSVVLTNKELKKKIEDDADVIVSESALSQTAKRISKEIEERAPLLTQHPLIAFIRDSVGLLARLDQLPQWVQKILAVHPATFDQPWGSPEDITQYVARLAAGSGQLVNTHDPQTNTETLWITPGGEQLTTILDEITDNTTNGSSTLLTGAELNNTLANAEISPQHFASVTEALTNNKNIIWLPSAQHYIAFHRQPAEQRRSRGSAVQRATDIINLVTDVDRDSLINDIINEFEAQHLLDRATAENAVRGLARVT